ncbi:uncharacterized protein LOC127856178 [Dreissena polymorpha]|uniref:uncharacterized protein LOC127856178 n=1 Tax=Dreissena polymorpha TaxID=45954 RepID=UPI002263BBCF|nr:uncharacterized protein LOC127856178 [Dreissena polymorpha]
MLPQCDVVIKCNDRQAQELSSDEHTDPEPKARDATTQVDEIDFVTRSCLNQNLHEMHIRFDNIKLMPCGEYAIISLDVLADGRILVLSECAMGLYSIKLTLISTFDIKHRVNDMCIVKENKDGYLNVAVCFHKLNKLQIVEHFNEFRELSYITCEGDVISISMCVYHLAVLLSHYEVQLLDIATGHVCYAYKEFRWTINGSIVRLCSPIRIHICSSKNLLIVVDENTIYSFNIKDGKCKEDTLYLVGSCHWGYSQFSCTKPEFKDANDVKCDSNGNIYVATSKSIYQVNSTGTARTLIQHYTDANDILYGFCKTCAIDEYRNRIVVGFVFSRYVRVYDYTLPTNDT